MKQAKNIIYWITTTLVVLELAAGGLMDFIQGPTSVIAGESVATVVTRLGYPLYVLIILGIWKIPGAIVILLPGFPRLKEWAYAGAIFNMTGAAASNIFCGQGLDMILAPIILALLAIISWALRPESRVLGGKLFSTKAVA